MHVQVGGPDHRYWSGSLQSTSWCRRTEIWGDMEQRRECLLGAHAAQRKRSREAAATALVPVEAVGAARAVRSAYLDCLYEGCCINLEQGIEGVPLVDPRALSLGVFVRGSL